MEHHEGQGQEQESSEGDVKKRAEADQPPVDGPSAGSGGERDDKDLAGGSSYDQPGDG